MELDPVQVAARERSKGRDGFGFWMQMGLGKTLTALTEFLDGVPNGITRMVVVSPNSFKSGWAEEVAKHELDIEAHIFVSGSWASTEFLKQRYTRPPLLIINYEAIRSQPIFDSVVRWMEQKPCYIAFDESIQIKTHNALQTKASIALSRLAKTRRILTGKPQTEGPHDLWAQMRAIGQLEGRNFYAFRSMFCRMGGFKNKQVIGAQNEDILAGMIEPHVFRATKEDWLFSIPKIYTTREYVMTLEQRNQYRSMEHEFVLWLENDDGYVTVDAAITKYIKLAQIQCGFIIDTDNDSKVHVICPPHLNPRVRLLKEILFDEVSGKAIVVYIHRYSFEILKEALAEYNPAWIKGGMEPNEIDEQKFKFNNDASCRVILVQERAGKFGHSLLGDNKNRCHTTIFFEQSYSLDDRSQIEDRNHRRGQDANSVTYVDLCGSSLDRNVARALQRKENVFQAVFKHIRKVVPA